MIILLDLVCINYFETFLLGINQEKSFAPTFGKFLTTVKRSMKTTAQWVKRVTVCDSFLKLDGMNCARHTVEDCCAPKDRIIGGLNHRKTVFNHPTRSV